MTVEQLLDQITRRLENPTVDEVWRHVIAYVAVSGAKIDITRESVEEYLRGKND